MAFAEVERLVTNLLGTGTIREETTNELHRFLAEARAGQLHPDDLIYLRELHVRILGVNTNVNTETTSRPKSKPQIDPLADALKNLTKARGEVISLWQELITARKTISLLQQQLSNHKTGDDRKFREIKKRFAKRYHPNAVGSAGIEAIIRAEFFKEFWKDIEEVEKS